MHTEDFWGDEPSQSKRIAAWRAHYMAKGCNSTKADTCAHRKVRQAWTWPPKQQI